MSRDYRELYDEWCDEGRFDSATKVELESLQDEKEIEDRFYRDLEFGTGGLRGVIGAGTNRMNEYTVRKASQGLANVVVSAGGAEKGIAIAYDSRRMSEEFALTSALCFAANGIKVYLFDGLRPTPELSFAVRHLGCMAGVVITASHNPPEYNGYKVYWEDGGQITAPKDKEIITEVNSISDYAMCKTMSKLHAIEFGLLVEIGEEIDRIYIEELKNLVVNLEAIQAMNRELKIVYTPIHGTGNLPVRRILSELGFVHTYIVKEQELPDGDFPTVAYPNPEDPAVFNLALELAKEVDADIILATDPDADRLGVYAKDPITKTYQSFTGNMSGALICEYELSQKKERNALHSDSAIVKTIVTTNMADAITEEYGVRCIETLTGFKYIGEQIRLFEEKKVGTFEFGFEESYGCLLGTYARDKDAIVAVMALCEAAAYYKQQGLTLWEQMTKLYEKYGYYKEDLVTITLKGQDGATKIKEMIEDLRAVAPTQIGNAKVISVSDFSTRKKVHMDTNVEEMIELPKSNVLYYELENNGWFCVRPSGTEPKIKFYMGVKGENKYDSGRKLEDLKRNTIDKYS